MKKIITVSGPVEPDSLGITSMFDYLFYDGSAECLSLRKTLPPACTDGKYFPMGIDEPVSLENVGILQRNALLSTDAWIQTDEKVLAEELRLFKQAGGGALLSLSAGAMKHSVHAGRQRKISEISGVLLIETAGYMNSEMYEKEFQGLSAKESFKKVIEAVENPFVHPGHLVAAVLSSSENEKNAFRAVARAAASTGYSMTVILGKNPEEEAEWCRKILKEEHVFPERVVVSNVPLYRKPARTEAIQNPSTLKVCTDLAETFLKQGFNISLCVPNVMSCELYGDYDCGDFMLFAGLICLIEKGYCRQIVLGNGCRGKLMLHSSGGEGYCRLLYYVLPMLKDTAVLSDYAIRSMAVENPARILAI